RHGPGPVVVEQPGHTGDAPSPLTRAHAQTHVAADVVDGAGADLDDRPDHVGAGRQLALADQVAVGLLFLYPGEAPSEPVIGLQVSAVGERLQVGATGTVDAELAAHRVDRDLG